MEQVAAEPHGVGWNARLFLASFHRNHVGCWWRAAAAHLSPRLRHSSALKLMAALLAWTYGLVKADPNAGCPASIRDSSETLWPIQQIFYAGTNLSTKIKANTPIITQVLPKSCFFLPESENKQSKKLWLSGLYLTNLGPLSDIPAWFPSFRQGQDAASNYYPVHICTHISPLESKNHSRNYSCGAWQGLWPVQLKLAWVRTSPPWWSW